MHFDMDYVDIFTLMDTIKSEATVLDGLGRLGLSDEQVYYQFCNRIWVGHEM